MTVPTPQAEALRLADSITASGNFTPLAELDAAAAELRRLHALTTRAPDAGWVKVSERLPKCSRKPDSFGVLVDVWPMAEGVYPSAYYGRRQAKEPNFYLHGAVLRGITHWRNRPAPPAPEALEVKRG